MATAIEETTEASRNAVRSPFGAEGGRPGRRRERTWAARIWIGMTLGAWTRMLARHRFAVHPFQWHTAALMLVVGSSHSVLRFLERRLLSGELETDRNPGSADLCDWPLEDRHDLAA